MFRGFNTTLPTYDVVTPQTKRTFSLRTLTVSDEEKLKATMMMPNKLTEHLNKCIYDAIVTKPEDIKDFDDFKSKLTILDRDALLYGLYHVTYEEERLYSVTCTNCGKSQSVTIEASKTFDMNPYPGEDDILNKRIDVKLPITKGYMAVIKQPTLSDEMMAYTSLLPRPNINAEVLVSTLMIDKICEITRARKTSVEDADVAEKAIYIDREDIVDAYLSLPAKDKKTINKAYYENFGQYCISLKMRVFCPHCGKEDISNIDLLSQFFRMALGD